MARKPKSVRRKVQEVVDGDTFRVRRRVKGSQFIRVAGFNAPEKGGRGFAEAKRKLKRMVEGKTVTLRPKGKSHGRTVAQVIYQRRDLAKRLRPRKSR